MPVPPPVGPLPEPDAPPSRARRGASVLGLLVSLAAVAGVVWWALRQDAPDLPDTGGEFAALAGAAALYGLATLLRSERWHRLLEADGARPRRADTYALTVIGYMGNNLLPARAGDAFRVLLLAPRAQASRRTVLGTLLAERLLDVVVILLLFLIVGYGVLGEVGAQGIEWVLLGLGVAALLGVVAVLLVRRNARLHELFAPILSSTLGLRRKHGLWQLGCTLVIWAVETSVWMAVGAGVGLSMSVLEGVYLVALASVFSMIPSGPGYAGTQDAAAVIGIRAIGGTGATAVAYLLMLRFVLLVPITLLGLVLLGVRYGGLGKLRGLARAEAPA